MDFPLLLLVDRPYSSLSIPAGRNFFSFFLPLVGTTAAPLFSFYHLKRVETRPRFSSFPPRVWAVFLFFFSRRVTRRLKRKTNVIVFPPSLLVLFLFFFLSPRLGYKDGFPCFSPLFHRGNPSLFPYASILCERQPQLEEIFFFFSSSPPLLRLLFGADCRGWAFLFLLFWAALFFFLREISSALSHRHLFSLRRARSSPFPPSSIKYSQCGERIFFFILGPN